MANYLYNGVELPDIDAVWIDKKTYYYAFILNGACVTGNAGDLEIQALLLCDKKIKVKEDGDAQWEDVLKVKTYAANNGSWELVLEQDIAYSNDVDFDMTGTLWTSRSIFNVDGSLFLRGSRKVLSVDSKVIETDGDRFYFSPNGLKIVPPASIITDEWHSLDGKHVIEWNGDTTGLHSILEGSLRKIDEKALTHDECVNAICVLENNDETREVIQFPIEITQDGCEISEGFASFSKENVLVDGENVGNEVGIYFLNIENEIKTKMLAYPTTQHVTVSKGDGYSLTHSGDKVPTSSLEDDTDAISLEGMNIIEWDLNRKGMENFVVDSSVGYTFYKVSDFFKKPGRIVACEYNALTFESIIDTETIQLENDNWQSKNRCVYAIQNSDIAEDGVYFRTTALNDTYFLAYDATPTDYLIKSNTISNIANSIRDKLGTSAKMLLGDMPNAIKSIATVGDSITITWDGQPTETVFDSRYYKVSDLYFNGTQLINATVTLTNGTEEVTGKYTDSRWNKLGLKTGDKGVAWGLELGLFSTDGTNTDLGASKGTYIGVLASGDYSGYWVSSITYPVTPDVLLQEKTITANGTYSADEGYDGISKVVVDVESSGSGSQTIVTTDSVTITNADVTVEDESTIVLGG